MTDLLTAAKAALDFLDYVQFMRAHIVNPELATDLRTAIEQAEKAEPVAHFDKLKGNVVLSTTAPYLSDNTPLYLHPAPAIQPGWQLVPKEPTQEMISDGHHEAIWRSGDVRLVWGAMLAAAPKYEGEGK